MIAKIWLRLRKFCNHSENFAILAKISLCTNFRYIAKITVHSENRCPMFFIPNDHILIIYHFVPIVITYFRHFWYFTQLGWLYKPPYDFCNPNFWIHCKSTQLFILGFSFLSSLSSFSDFLGNQTYLGDDKPRYAWLMPPFLEEEGHWWRFGGKFSCPLIYHTAFMSI